MEIRRKYWRSVFPDANIREIDHFRPTCFPLVNFHNWIENPTFPATSAFDSSWHSRAQHPAAIFLPVLKVERT